MGKRGDAGMERIYGFPPVDAPDATMLILGSMPSVQSLQAEFYYAHPQNAFWRILSDSWACPLPQSVAEKKRMLIDHGAALWDSAGSCERQGSLDSAMRNVAVNDFAPLFARCPHIERIFFNGQTAQKLFLRGARPFLEGRRAFLLPSTSPAHTMKYADKLAAWRRAILNSEGVEI